MKTAYPVIFKKIDEGYLASAPDFPLDTHGSCLADAIAMARDAIGIMGISLQDDDSSIPTASNILDIECEDDDIVSMVDIDFAAYRRQVETRSVRRNISLPSWLNEEADKAGLNVSAIVQSALKQELQITDR